MFTRPSIGERDLLTINYTSGTTSRPKGVMITHRNAWVNSVGMLAHIRMTPGDAYLWTLPMFHANGWTFTWTVTAVGAKHVCLRKVEAAAVFRLAAAEDVTWMCAAPTVLITLASAPAELKALCPAGCQRDDGGSAAGGGDHRAPGRRAGLDGDPDLRAHRNRAGHLHLRAAPRAPRPARRANVRASKPARVSNSSPRASCGW